MTMRSMPPASSHLAESPVPAPPPMIGSPRRDHAAKLARGCLACEAWRGSLAQCAGGGDLAEAAATSASAKAGSLTL